MDNYIFWCRFPHVSSSHSWDSADIFLVIQTKLKFLQEFKSVCQSFGIAEMQCINQAEHYEEDIKSEEADHHITF